MDVLSFICYLLSLVGFVITDISEPVKLQLYRTPKSGDEAVLRRTKRGLYDQQRNNLEGKPGQGYYITVFLGNPIQQVS